MLDLFYTMKREEEVVGETEKTNSRVVGNLLKREEEDFGEMAGDEAVVLAINKSWWSWIYLYDEGGRRGYWWEGEVIGEKEKTNSRVVGNLIKVEEEVIGEMAGDDGVVLAWNKFRWCWEFIEGRSRELVLVLVNYSRCWGDLRCYTILARKIHQFHAVGPRLLFGNLGEDAWSSLDQKEWWWWSIFVQRRFSLLTSAIASTG